MGLVAAFNSVMVEPGETAPAFVCKSCDK
jgi:hypothetical protein